MAMMRFCPNCHSERSLYEIFCEGVIDSTPCGWDLSNEPIRETGWRPQIVVTAEKTIISDLTPHCTNGHTMEEGDLICMVCGADLVEQIAVTDPVVEEVIEQSIATIITDETTETVVDGWHLLNTISSTDSVRVRYLAEREEDNRRAVLTLYSAGAEPDVAVYDVLKGLPREHVPEIIAQGRWNSQAYVVAEELTGGTLSDLGIVINDLATIRHVMTELGEALQAFAEVGLRHCDLRPETLLVRSREPLDLVITGFGSARLSEFDLEVISPLTTTLYTAPEVVAGGVSAASDWWSLGIILLEQLTQGRCFEGVNTHAFLIQVLTNGIDIPTELDPRLQLLLRGLLAKDHHQRWQWSQVKAWINDEVVTAPEVIKQTQDIELGATITLAGKTYHSPKLFALSAADPINWQEAQTHMLRGRIVTWLEQAEFDQQELAKIREVFRQQDLSSDIQLMLVLKVLNPDMPLILKGDIVTPSWLLQHPLEGYQLITDFIPNLLKDLESWLWRLHERANTVSKRAKNLHIKLDEEVLKIHLLSTSRAQLTALWEERWAILPDASNVGLLSLMERRIISEEDLIVLLSAEIGQFKSIDTVIEETVKLGEKFDILTAVESELRLLINQPRLALYQTLNERVEGFANTGHEQVDKWAEQYRLEKRMPLARLLLLLSIPAEQWSKPHKQQYVSQIIDFFHKKVTTAVLQGPLVRMYMGMYTGRVDITLLGTERRSANHLLDHILERNNRQISIDATAFQNSNYLEYQLNNLYRQSNLYKRDTGIDGLYMGFPFLLYQEPHSYRLPRIAPLLLWPIKLNYDMGLRNRITLAFDSEREEIRINPALEGMLGKELYQAWKKVLDDLLARSALTAIEVMDALSLLGNVLSQHAQALPINLEVSRGEVHFACSAVLFDVNFMGQSIGEELNRLKKMSPVGTALETALRLKPYQAVAETPEKPAELDRYFTVASDPSQENAVLQSRQEPGLLIEGPPGTGKSQTIVNMVGDAIGRNKTVLIVCQKKAALEVVHKRLVAEGLGARSVMVNDVNGDRNAVIGSVRDQLDNLFRAPQKTDWQVKRKQVAEKITKLEKQLDSYHEALHYQDQQTGLTYRQLIAELIGLNKEYSLFAAPQLRPIVSPLNIQQLAELEDECAPLICYWLPANYEGSPLVNLQAFSHDLATIEDFKNFFEQFLTVEQSRIDTLNVNKARFELSNPTPYQHWIDTESNAFLNISENLRARLIKWLPFFKVDSNKEATLVEGDLLVNQLKSLQERLAIAKESGWCDLSAKLCLLEQDVLDELLQKARIIVTPAPWYSFLSIKRYKTRRSLLDFLALQGDIPAKERIPMLYNALVLEHEYRPIRKELQAVCAKLQLPVPENTIGSKMKQVIQDTLGLLLEIKGWSEKISAAPRSEDVEAAIIKNRIAFEQLLADYTSAFNRHFARKASLEKLDSLANYLMNPLYDTCKVAIEQNTATPLDIIDIKRCLSTTAAYQYFRKRVEQLTPTAVKLFAKLRIYQQEFEQFAITDLDKKFRQLINYEARNTWKERLEQNYPALLVNYEETQQRIASLAEADIEMRDLNRVLLEQNISIKELASSREWEDITRLTGQRARRLREFIEQGEKLGLMKLRPIWLMNPDVASRLLPLKAGLFDMVIYDEASQMPIEYAIPTLYRGKIVVISGDEKQMPPSSFFATQVEVDEEDIDLKLSFEDLSEEEQQEALQGKWNSKEIMDCPDLLQLARSVLPTTGLQIHYRSVYRELIDYSNAAFYSNQLNIPVRHPLETVKQAKPIEYLRVNGVYEDQTNLLEAKKIVSKVARIWLQPKEQRPSLGVVTFNKKQADLIESLFYNRANRDKNFAAAYKEESQRVESGEDMSVFIKNVENVQGDERDIVLFSTTFGRNKGGIFWRKFGVLGQQGGERRLNVAITRARKKIILVSSMPIEEVSDMLVAQHLPSTPRDYLQCYLEYARALSEGEFDNAKAILNRVVTVSHSRVETLVNKQKDAFLDDVEDYIKSLGVNYTRNSGSDVFALDFAIEDPKTNLYCIGIECDAPINPLLSSARSRDIWRTSVLKRAIPNIYRISSHGWYEYNEQVKQRLKQAVEDILIARETSV